MASPASVDQSRKAILLSGTKCRSLRGGRLLPACHDDQRKSPNKKRDGREPPQQGGAPLEARPEQHEFAVSSHQVVGHLLIAIAFCQPFADQNPDVTRQW